VVRDRWDAEHLDDHKLPYAQERPAATTLLDAVQQVKPTVLIGLSDSAPPHAFTKEVRWQPGCVARGDHLGEVYVLRQAAGVWRSFGMRVGTFAACWLPVSGMAANFDTAGGEAGQPQNAAGHSFKACLPASRPFIRCARR
jgi:hypothetical protein